MYNIQPLDCASEAWIKFQTFRKYMVISNIVLLIAIRPLDGEDKPSAPLGAYRQE